MRSIICILLIAITATAMIVAIIVAFVTPNHQTTSYTESYITIHCENGSVWELPYGTDIRGICKSETPDS